MRKHLGWERSSRLMPPNEGCSIKTVSMILSGSLVSSMMATPSTPPKVFVEQGFAFHDRQACLRANITQAQDARAITDDGNGVPLVGIVRIPAPDRRQSPGRAQRLPVYTRWRSHQYRERRILASFLPFRGRRDEVSSRRRMVSLLWPVVRQYLLS